MANQANAKRRESTVVAESDFFRRNRETIESIVIAVVLAFLFRTFLAEAFVIPTGSMAPTLMGRHVDIQCEQCGYQFPAGASIENDNGARAVHGMPQQVVIRATCPLCRYSVDLKRKDMDDPDMDHESFNGDRILVEKFTYNIWDPQRWDVIVFKYPGNAKQNYIKRLIGLPNEAIRIRHGDIFTRPTDSNKAYRIARKPPAKMLAMMQMVHDTNYTAKDLAKADWPARWQPWSPRVDGGTPQTSRVSGGERNGFQIAGSSGEQWFRYYHYLHRRSKDWPGPIDKDAAKPNLITDHYAYNDAQNNFAMDPHNPNDGELRQQVSQGHHWVGDICAEFEVQIKNDEGTVVLEIVEGGVHYQCHINVGSGQAKLTMGKSLQQFESDDKTTRTAEPLANTRVRGAGTYRLRFSNFDNQLRLWVNSRLVKFNGPTTFATAMDSRPTWSQRDPGDISPIAIAGRGADLIVKRARLHRDVYYIATRSGSQSNDEYDLPTSPDEIHRILHDPKLWSSDDGTAMFDSRPSIDSFQMGEGQYFPLGDNSPQSKDARYWSGSDEAEVTRKLLTGKALFIYWPHPWRYVIPNFKRMKIIR